ncbi:hypothetical protein GGD65_001624 [Bradyrhizobium sp. CIR18]|uniref:hypothetical protein n=1 Tax=Bradyrhizobium sp. CIR18 TaxID=2663839 RepID=UPI001605F7B8|nr:hypothetical protein [Bradyrhizobium sp. CIR18]MBB4360626.1 hypothetical protein [Bradyrhizobium sp. CIR18]
MFEITRDDIAALNDEDLRTLIGLLCEAVLRRANLPLSGVTYGGDQNAKDGGLDVRVSLAAGTVIEGFIPCAATGFQVKKPDMPPAEIPKEMKPKGVVRPVIEELAAASGAYIIVSSTGSTADSALTKRRAAMAEAVSGVANAGNLHLDFYDRSRIATWVREHAGIILWVRSRIGKSVPGWQAFGSWSHVPAGADKTYLLDEAARIKTGRKDDGEGLSAVEGIDRIREKLRKPGQVVRLVGLSGVGKTRLVEALFDPAIGANALDPSLAVYADAADELDPPPKGMASDLVASETRAILVIDNCPPETHKQVAQIAQASGAAISVISIEYDIQDEAPEGTDVFSLETSSLLLIEKLVRARFSEVSQVDARTIAEFSGGNARIALALAGTVKKSETVANLSHTELFTRLFQQRQGQDAGLLQIAEACSLVYSFQGEALTGENAELPVLGGLIGRSAQEVYTAAAELKRRDLLQQRREWRAVLPHAIANRLAARALQNIPYAVIETTVVNGPSSRLLSSFSRRLGYLAGSKEAQAIVGEWLAPGGMLSDVLPLNETGQAIFENVAPVLPEATLSALEKVFARAGEDTLLRGGRFIRLIRSLAYDANLFERAIKLLRKFGEVRQARRIDGEAQRAFASLFYIVFSGTRAPLAMRLNVLDGFLTSDDALDQHLGLQALEAMLETDNFRPFSGFEFGTRSRDYGYHPKNGREVGDWFEEVLKITERFALGNLPVSERVRRVFARQFRGLWRDGGRLDVLERLAQALAAGGFWRDSWIAVRQARQYDGERLEPESLRRLEALEEFLRPKDLVNRVRGIVLRTGDGRSLDYTDTGSGDTEGLEEDASKALARAQASVENLGRDLVVDAGAFATLLPELIGGGGRLGEFGRGLALGAEDARATWQALVAQVRSTDRPNIHVLHGFLRGLRERDADLVEALLDGALEGEVLAEWLPELQASFPINEAGVARLRKALDLGRAPIDRFGSLSGGDVCALIPGPEFRDLISAIRVKPGGSRVALDILYMRLHSNTHAGKPLLPEMAEAGRTLLAQHIFVPRSHQAENDDHRLGDIARRCLVGMEGAPVAQKIWRDLKAALHASELYSWEHDELVQALFVVQPDAMLDVLVEGGDDDRKASIEIIDEITQQRQNPINSVADDTLLAWCEVDPVARYPFAAAIAPLFESGADKTPKEWRPLVKALLEKAPEPVSVFRGIAHHLWPMSIEGSIASAFEARLHLLDKLEIGSDSALLAVFRETRDALAEDVEKWRRSELREGRGSGRFE